MFKRKTLIWIDDMSILTVIWPPEQSGGTSQDTFMP
ncbi:hypothetical protein MPC1_1190001 [Methylocella tundrae]|nr:hypothetical protein MPC1_1190001 [Methylocella tundrae]